MSRLETALQNLSLRGQTPSISTFNSIISSFALIQDFDNVKLTFSRISQEGFTPNVQTYAHIISAFQRSNLSAEAEVYWKLMADNVVIDIDVYNALFVEFIQENDFDSVVRLYTRLRSDPNVAPSFASFDILIKGAKSLKHIDFAYNRLFEMRDTYKIKPLILHYNNILQLLSSSLDPAKRSQRAREIIQCIREDGLRLNAASYTSLLRIFCHDSTNAIHYLDEFAKMSSTRKPRKLAFVLLLRSAKVNHDHEFMYAVLDRYSLWLL